MAWTDFLLTAGILIFIALLIWSRVQNQMMLDTMREIRDFFTESFGTSKEKIEEVIKQ